MKPKVIDRKYLFPFILVTVLFSLWGFANDITNPMVAAFKTIMEISNAKASLVQFAFYGGYATMAIPAALFIKKFSYKSGIVLGLALYAVGAFLFIPAAEYEMFGFFLASLYILTFGLAFLETTANPYILSMGDESTATRRLNLAQSFNPLGSLIGMFVASKFVLAALESDKRDAAGNLIFETLSTVEKSVIRTHDLAVIRNPYALLGVAVFVMLVIISIAKMPKTQSTKESEHSFVQSTKRLFANEKYRFGVVAQLFYVAAQIMCWTFIIQYAENIGLTKEVGQNYNILAMSLFLLSRFVATYLMKYFKPAKMLLTFAIGGMLSLLGVIFVGGMSGLYCLVATSIFMSLMFPTIYGISLYGLREDSTVGAAFLVMAIIGGALMPILQGTLIDFGTIFTLPAVNFSFILPFICFVVIAAFSTFVIKQKDN